MFARLGALPPAPSATPVPAPTSDKGATPATSFRCCMLLALLPRRPPGGFRDDWAAGAAAQPYARGEPLGSAGSPTAGGRTIAARAGRPRRAPRARRRRTTP